MNSLSIQELTKTAGVGFSPTAIRRKLSHIGGLIAAIPPNQMGPLLVWRSCEHSEVEWSELKPAPMRIGRSGENDVVLDSISVSRVHAELVPENGSWWLRDLNSSNGTFIDGLRVKNIFISNGQLIRFGSIDVLFLATEDFEEGFA